MSKKFEVEIEGLKLKFELYEYDEIENELISWIDQDFIESYHSVIFPEIKYARYKYLFNDISIEEGTEKKKYQYFSYIKFFRFTDDNGVEKKYGLVAGKTSYSSIDVSFDYLEDEKDKKNKKDKIDKKDKRIARNFLEQKELKWDHEIIVVNHKPHLELDVDERQALFLECFLQRKFNLFDS